MVIINDFLNYGKYEISSGMYDQNRLSNYIVKYERKYLIELFGATMYEAFMTSIDPNNNQSSAPKFQELIDPFAMDISTFTAVGYVGTHTNLVRRVVISDGMKEMLMGFIYFEYLKDSISVATPVGIVQPVGENSKVPNTLHIQIYTRYNEAVRTFRAIQERIIANPNDYDYSDFNGIHKSLAYWI